MNQEVSAIEILVITPQYAPDRGPSAPIYTALCEDLCQRGYEVTVVTGFPHYGSDHVWPEYRGKLAQEERLNGVRVLRTYVYAARRQMWQRMIYHALFNVAATLGVFYVGRPDVVLADAPALWSGLPLLTRAIAFRIPYIYILHDIYPDMAVRLGVLTNPVLLSLIDRLERFFYAHASYVSVLADGFKENLLRKGVAAEKISVIPACTDTDFVQPLAHGSKFRALWGLQGKFVVLYTANIGLPQGLDNVLRAAQLLMDYPDIAVVFVGEGNAKLALQAMVRNEKITNVYFFPLQAREEVPDVFGLADVSLISLRREIVMEAVPSKTYSIMASGRPMIATVQSGTEVARLIRQANCGLYVEPGDPKALAEAILQLYTDASLRGVMGQNGRRYVVENYSREVATRKYQTLIESLTR